MELSEVSKRSPQDKQRLDPLASTLGLSVSLDPADLGVLFLLCGMRKFERTTKLLMHICGYTYSRSTTRCRFLHRVRGDSDLFLLQAVFLQFLIHA